MSYDPRVPGDVDAAQRRLTNCIAEVKDWMLANKLRLNDTKTEFFLISSPGQINSVLRVNLRIGGSVIAPSSSIKNLGVTFDPHLKMDLQVASICRTVNFHLRNISRIRRFIDQDTCAHMWFDLWSFLGWITATLCLVVRRALTFSVCKSFKIVLCALFSVSVDALVLRHYCASFIGCRSVQQRIDFKISVHVYNCVNSLGPTYLSDLVSSYGCAREGLR